MLCVVIRRGKVLVGCRILAPMKLFFSLVDAREQANWGFQDACGDHQLYRLVDGTSPYRWVGRWYEMLVLQVFFVGAGFFVSVLA